MLFRSKEIIDTIRSIDARIVQKLENTIAQISSIANKHNHDLIPVLVLRTLFRVAQPYRIDPSLGQRGKLVVLEPSVPVLVRPYPKAAERLVRRVDLPVLVNLDLSLSSSLTNLFGGLSLEIIICLLLAYKSLRLRSCMVGSDRLGCLGNNLLSCFYQLNNVF